MTSTDSPMPELLSLKDRLKLFEKEIEDQHKEPEPKKDRKFSFLSQDEVDKMKEEEAKRIASMTAINMEALDKYDTSAPHQTIETVSEVSEEKEEVREEAETTEDSAEKRAQWRKARLESLEEDAIQAQIVIEKMSELSTSTTTGFADDNAAYRQPVDTQGNITEEAVKEPIKGIQGVKEMMETGDTDSDMTTSEDRTEGLSSPLSPGAFPEQQ